MKRAPHPSILMAVLATLLALSGQVPAHAGPVSYTLTVAKAGNGRGTVSSLPVGVDCGTTCSAMFTSGTVVTLTATANSAGTFTGWMGGGCSGTGTCDVTLNADTTVKAIFTRFYRPDAWINWCGSGDNCIGAKPHKWRGNDVYNKSGKHQTFPAGVEEGNDIRFWIVIQNDGALSDTIYVKGCLGNPSFFIRVVKIGKLRRSQYAPIVTKEFRNGKLKFAFDPGATAKKVIITLDIWAKTSVFNAKYTCPVTIHSANQPTLRDRVVAKMVTT